MEVLETSSEVLFATAFVFLDFDLNFGDPLSL